MYNVSTKRIKEVDFIRAICTLGIFFNHFSAAIDNSILYKLWYTFYNGGGSVGYTLVTVFFVLSGAVLYHNYNNLSSIKDFYKKRFIGIYPEYYCIYCIAICAMLFVKKGYFVDKKLGMIIFTVLGMDGYFSSYFDTWSLIGEWFIGAIILLYILFPLINWIMKKNTTILMIVLLVLFCITFKWEMLNQNSFRNIFSCLISFFMGMLIKKYRVYEKRNIFPISIILFILGVLFANQINLNILSHICGISLFFILYYVGNLVGNEEKIYNVINIISNCSYEIFLTHHIIILFFVSVIHLDYVNTSIAVVASLFLLIIVVLVSYSIHKAFDKILKK